MGMVAVARITANRNVLKGNLYFANIKPDKLDVSSTKNIDPIEMIKELRM